MVAKVIAIRTNMFLFIIIFFLLKANYIALYKMLPQYSDKTSKSKSVSRLDKISNTIKGEVFYTTGWTMPELLCACLSGCFART